MQSLSSLLSYLLILSTTFLLAACGGGGGGGSSAASTMSSITLTNPAQGQNVTPIIVDGGLSNNVNIPSVSVKVCLPGSTSQCQTINHILVDTGSYGLRIFSNQVTSFTLPNANQINQGSLTECVQFADGYTYGPVVNLDVSIAGETASNIPVNVLTSPLYTNVPSTCAAGTALQSPSLFGSNGVLGIGDQINDGDYGMYYTCATQGSCTPITASFTSGFVVVNPVSNFLVDHNGVIINLPAINSTTGAASATGQLIFGINTQTNNTLPSNASVITPNAYNYFNSNLNNINYPSSFIDSGSNGLFFNTNLAIPQCPQGTAWFGFYCPSTPLSLTAQITLANGTPSPVPFSVSNPQNYPSNAYALDNLAGTQLAQFNNSFDWGLPFFFGKNVYVFISNTPQIAFVTN
ncbi:hypothetical protein FERRO_19800 [Ferrovum sp. JA12]|uniref:DUF3443 family protein n=1 Tax=Ferrovum sp. JA12 TaxID=1356299 RepID=UPI0007030A58|nr:DUF3443 family protein [Ferrovum sp. JA12]KRH78025.1 hypothetical protein FERRO_19800 [Ferrovum sp. JA12]